MKGNRNVLPQDLQCESCDSKKVLLLEILKMDSKYFALMNPVIGTKPPVLGKLNHNGRERADAHSHAGVSKHIPCPSSGAALL